MAFITTVKKVAVVGWLLFLCPGIMFGQGNDENSLGAGLPYFTNFEGAEHGGGQQSWDMVQDKRGVIYIANSYGVLRYDGSRWKLINFDGSYHIFQLAYDERTDRIYTGGASEIGYLEADSIGKMQYHSLLSEIDSEHRSFSRIRFGLTWNEDVWFSTANKIFIWNGQQMNIIPARSLYPQESESSNIEEATFGNYFIRDGELYVEHSGKGLLRWTGTTFNPVQKSAEMFQKIGPTRFLYPHENNKILAGTSDNELYFLESSLTEVTRFRTEADEFLKQNRLHTARILNDGSIALGTTRGGVAIVDSTGQWQQLINKKAGLLDNKIHFILQEKNGGIWLAMNVGLARIDWPPVISTFDDRTTTFGEVLSITSFGNRLYVGAYSGLYRSEDPVFSALLGNTSSERFTFRKMEMSFTGVWDLLPTSNGLLVGTEEGIFQLDPESGQRKKILSKRAAKLQFARKYGEAGKDSLTVHALLADGYARLSFDPRNNIWEADDAPYLNEFGHSMVQDTNSVWFATFRPSVYHMEDHYDADSTNFTRYEGADGLPAQGPYTAGLFEDELRIGTNDGSYQFLKDENRFVPDPDFNELLGGPLIFENLTTDDQGNAWLEAYDGENSHIYQLKKNDDGSYTRQKAPFNRIAEPEPHFFYQDPLNPDITWINVPRALLRYDERLHAQKEYGAGSTLIQEVRSIKNDSLLLVNLSDSLQIEFPPQRNALRFAFALPGNDDSEETTFRYYLEGFDDDWSSWTDETQKDYTNIPPGTFTFHVQGQNVYQQTGKVASFTFHIATPWYLSHLAWIIYISTGLLFLGWIIRSYGHYQARRQRYIEQVKTDEREKVRKKMAADFHDDMGNRITRISLLTKLLQQNDNDRAKEFLQKIEDNASALYSETRDFIWQMDPEKDSLFNTFAWLKEFGEELFEDSGPDFKTTPIPAGAENIHLEMEPRGHMIRIFKEAMHNTLKHSGARICTLKVELNEHKAAVIFSDDGQGLNISDQRNTGNGLNNMRQRAKQAGGSLEIRSEPGSGTSIRYIFGMDE